MLLKLHLISVFMQIRCNFPDISYFSEMQKNNFQFLNRTGITGTMSWSELYLTPRMILYSSVIMLFEGVHNQNVDHLHYMSVMSFSNKKH